MKKFLVFFVIAISFLIAGCDKELDSDVENEIQLKSAGTNYTVPNIFDAEGKYDTKDSYGKLHQRVRHTFRIVKVTFTPDKIEII